MSARWKQGMLALASIGVSILPKLAFPACWPAYAGLLTSIGLGFLISVVYLLPLTVAFLSLALGAMLFRARERRGYGPFLLGVAAAGGGFFGKVLWAGNTAPYGSVGPVVISSLSTKWPRPRTANAGRS